MYHKAGFDKDITFVTDITTMVVISIYMIKLKVTTYNVTINDDKDDKFLSLSNWYIH